MTNLVNDIRRSAFRMLRWVVIGASILAGVYLTFLALDLLVDWSVYGWFFRKLAGAGLPDYLSGMVAVWFTVWVITLVPTAIVSILKRRKDWIYKTAALMTVWFGVMYFLTQPYGDGLFNPYTGTARFRHSTSSDGVIKRFPMGFRYDPDTGRELRDFDQKTAEEYYKQQGLAPQKQGVSAAGGLRGLLARLRRSVSPQGETASAEQTDTPTVVAGQNPFESDLSSTSNLWLRVEKVQVGPDRTILHLASRAPESEEGMLVAAVQEQTYLVDENGQTYMLQADSGNYPRKSYRTILRDETYRFTMTFPALRPGIKRLKFYRSRFSPIVLDELLAQAERLPEVRQASGVRQAVEVNVTPAPASPAPFVTPPAEVRESEPGLAHIKAEEPGPKRPAARYFQLGLGMGPIRSHGIPGYDLWIQRMQLEPGATILHFVASGISGDSGLLNPATSPPGSLPHCYLTDDQGPALRALGRRGGV